MFNPSKLGFLAFFLSENAPDPFFLDDLQNMPDQQIIFHGMDILRKRVIWRPKRAKHYFE